VVELQADGGAGRHARPARSRLFFRVRVALLLLVLLGVLIYAAKDHAARGERRAWQRPLHVALVLLQRGALEPAALEAFVARVPALEAALEREFQQHGGSFSPIRFWRFGPVAEPEPAPVSATAPSWLEPLRISFELYQYARASDAASDVQGTFDGKIYVVLSAPRSERRALVEGLGQDGGRIAVTHIELSEHSVDFGLFVVAHELFHLLGAADRYGADGATSIPDGLGDPERDPLYPQDSTEVMARARVIEPGVEVAPSDLAELRVGARTAVEIGWRAAR
jgi:hypothetical protein